jgi:glycerophosphoryl diester phosphodiesterase
MLLKVAPDPQGIPTPQTKTPEQLKQDGMDGMDYHFNTHLQEKPDKRGKSKSLSLNAWTVNETEDIDRLLSQGFDYTTK